MKRFYIPDSVKSWIENGNYYEKTENGFILFSGYFSGDSIPSTLRDILSNLYDELGSVQVEFLPR